MAKEKFQLVGDNFTHLSNGNRGYSTHGKESKNIEWTKDYCETVFYLDDFIHIAKYNEDSSRKQYGWICESQYITPDIVNYAKSNVEECVAPFEAIFTHNKELINLHNKFKFAPASAGVWVKDFYLRPKIKLISMISSSKSGLPGYEKRLSWVDRLKNSVDLYGRGFNEIEFKEQGLEDYMFSVAIENGSYETYFTEKILDCFATGTVPIYLGAPDIGNYFNPEGIIELEDGFEFSESIYYSKIDAIKENCEIAKKFELAEDYIYERYFL
jgi:hypothetical protein